MNPATIIKSGILINYCLGFCTAGESEKIEALADKHPMIKEEIENIRHSLEERLLRNAIDPPVSVKWAVMRSVYKEQSKEDQRYAPLIDEHISTVELQNWVDLNDIRRPGEDYDNLFITEMPSTELVINFIVSAKNGHDTEIHEDFVEYLYVISGSCTMKFEEYERSFVAGQIISIPPHINHSAFVTSAEPMLALVQRQKL